KLVTGVQTCALPIFPEAPRPEVPAGRRELGHDDRVAVGRDRPAAEVHRAGGGPDDHDVAAGVDGDPVADVVEPAAERPRPDGDAGRGVLGDEDAAGPGAGERSRAEIDRATEL